MHDTRTVGLTVAGVLGKIHAHRTKRENMHDIITTAMLAAILIPIMMIGVSDARRHPWGK